MWNDIKMIPPSKPKDSNIVGTVVKLNNQKMSKIKLLVSKHLKANMRPESVRPCDLDPQVWWALVNIQWWRN